MFVITACNSSEQITKEQTNTAFIYAHEMNVLDSDHQELKFNIEYSVLFEKEKAENCDPLSKKEINDILIVPTIRDITRKKMATITQSEIHSLDKNTLKNQINEQLRSGVFSLNGEVINPCKVSIGLFTITERK